MPSATERSILEVWMLRQSDKVRESYLRDVLLAA